MEFIFGFLAIFLVILFMVRFFLNYKIFFLKGKKKGKPIGLLSYIYNPIYFVRGMIPYPILKEEDEKINEVIQKSNFLLQLMGILFVVFLLGILFGVV